MPTYEMLDLIAQSGVGHVGNFALLLLQTYISLFFEVKFLFSSIKGRSAVVKTCVSILPLILILTYSFVGGLFFSAFLGQGPSESKMVELVNITLLRQCVYEMMFFVAVFFVLMIIYCLVYHLKPLQWLLTFGMEMLASAALLVLYGGLFVQDFPFTIFDLCRIDIYFARWPIYGYFIVIFKCFVLVVALFLGLFLHQRKIVVEEEEEYRDRNAYYEKRVLQFLVKDDFIVGMSFCVFAAASAIFIIAAISREKTAASVESISTLLFVFVLFLSVFCMGAILVYRSLWPRTTKIYRQLLMMGNRETVFRLFCEEVLESYASAHKIQFNNASIETPHFFLRRQGMVMWVEGRGEFRH